MTSSRSSVNFLTISPNNSMVQENTFTGYSIITMTVLTDKDDVKNYSQNWVHFNPVHMNIKVLVIVTDTFGSQLLSKTFFSMKTCFKVPESS